MAASNVAAGSILLTLNCGLLLDDLVLLAYYLLVNFLKFRKMQVLSEPRTKVNGKFLSQFNGKPVSLLGRVLKVHSSGSSFEIKSTDNQIITVILNEPLTENLENWIEVRGNGQGRSTIICHHIVPLSSVINDSFDVALYDDVINVINSCTNPWVNSGKN